MASFAFPATCKVASYASSTLLITASAGFGAYYAASQGAEHGGILGCLFVAMALGLELAKPFAITSAIEALKQWRVVQAAMLAMLALVAITYSLSAELSLMAATRGDQAAKRSAENEAAARTTDRYQRAKAELTTMRPAAELQSLIDAAVSRPKLKGCVEPEIATARQQCAQVAEWRAQQRRRTELEATMDGGDRLIVATKVADPAATALAMYLTIFGLHVPADLLTELLILVGVLALEVGSALSIVLVEATGRDVTLTDINTVPGPTERANIEPKELNGSEPGEQQNGEANENGRLGSALMARLRQAPNGEMHIGQRGLARLLQCSLAETNRTIHALAKAGQVQVSIDRLRGTTLALA